MSKQDNQNSLKLLPFLKDHLSREHATLLAMIFDNLVTLGLTIDEMDHSLKTSESDHVKNKSLTGALFCAVQIKLLTETFLSNRDLLLSIEHPIVKDCVRMADNQWQSSVTFMEQMNKIMEKHKSVAQPVEP